MEAAAAAADELETYRDMAWSAVRRYVLCLFDYVITALEYVVNELLILKSAVFLFNDQA